MKVSPSQSAKKEALERFNRLDCGIALLHIQLGALRSGVNGSFQFLCDPDVAIFKKEQ